MMVFGASKSFTNFPNIGVCGIGLPTLLKTLSTNPCLVAPRLKGIDKRKRIAQIRDLYPTLSKMADS